MKWFLRIKMIKTENEKAESHRGSEPNVMGESMWRLVFVLRSETGQTKQPSGENRGENLGDTDTHTHIETKQKLPLLSHTHTQFGVGLATCVVTGSVLRSRATGEKGHVCFVICLGAAAGREEELVWRNELQGLKHRRPRNNKRAVLSHRVMTDSTVDKNRSMPSMRQGVPCCRQTHSWTYSCLTPRSSLLSHPWGIKYCHFAKAASISHLH